MLLLIIFACCSQTERPCSRAHSELGQEVMYLYLGSNPRVLYLVTSSHDDKLGRPRRGLVFRAGENQSQAIVKFLPKEQIDLTNAVLLSTRVVKGCLGLISIDNGTYPCSDSFILINLPPEKTDIFLALVTSATEVGNTRPSGSKPESVARIHEVSFFSLNYSTWDDLSAETTGPDGLNLATNRDTPAATPAVFEHPCLPLTKILSSGSFYYALDSLWDLSTRLSVRLARDTKSSGDLGTFDGRFVWNESIVRSLLDFRERLDPQERDDMDSCQFIVCLPFLFFLSKGLISYTLDTCNTRLCGRFYYGFTCPSDHWNTYNCYPLINI